MMQNHIDISVIVTAHSEGRLIHRTLRSLVRAAVFAEEYNIRTEVIVVMDRPDIATGDYLLQSAFADRLHVYHTDLGDPGLSRNLGVSKASGKYVAFLDGDDLFGKTWLKAAFEEAERRDGLVVLHPEYVIVFEAEALIAKPMGTSSRKFNPQNLFEHNYWTSCLFVPRVFALGKPFAATQFEQCFGYEDWHWCCEVVAEEIPILIVPETVFFYRKKKNGSRLDRHNVQRVLIPPTKLFDPDTFSRVIRNHAVKNSTES